MVHTVSLPKTAGVVGGAVLLAAIGVLMARDPAGDPPAWVGWSIAAFFTLSAVAGVWSVVQGATVRIDEVGIQDSRWKLSPIPWAEIAAVSLVTIRGTRFLALHLADEGRFLDRLTPGARRIAAANRALGLPPAAISFVGLSPGIDAAWNQIRTERPHLVRS